MGNKNISDLVRDMYKILEDRSSSIDVHSLSKMMAKRLSEKQGGPSLRMSSIGEKCARKLWYKEHMPEVAEKIPGHTAIKFLTGDILEEIILTLAEQAGHKVEARQEEVIFEGVKGHVDAIIDGFIVDVKSANSRSMEKFRRHTLERDDPFGYLDQIGIYAEALRDDPRLVTKGEGAFLAADKELGHIILDRYRLPKRDWKGIIASIRDKLSWAEPPARAYIDEADGKSGNRQIPMPCRYCAFKKECWKDSNGGMGLREYIYRNGPRWLTKVIREPNVLENSKVE